MNLERPEQTVNVRLFELWPSMDGSIENNRRKPPSTLWERTLAHVREWDHRSRTVCLLSHVFVGWPLCLSRVLVLSLSTTNFPRFSTPSKHLVGTYVNTTISIFYLCALPRDALDWSISVPYTGAFVINNNFDEFQMYSLHLMGTYANTYGSNLPSIRTPTGCTVQGIGWAASVGCMHELPVKV